MNKAKAQALMSFLVGLDYMPTLKLVGIGNYSVTVASNSGATSAQIANVEANQGVVATIQQVEFN